MIQIYVMLKKLICIKKHGLRENMTYQSCDKKIKKIFFVFFYTSHYLLQ